MAKYSIVVGILLSKSYEIEADDEQKAIEIANEMAGADKIILDGENITHDIVDHWVETCEREV